MDPAGNAAFLARQMLLLELRHGQCVDMPGGVLSWGRRLWAGIWNPQAFGDPERFITSTREEATGRGLSWAGAIVIASGASAPVEEDLSDALFVYGMPEATGPPHCSPQVLLALTTSPGLKPARGVTAEPAEPDNADAAALLDSAAASGDRLLGPALAADAVMADSQAVLLRAEGKPAGLALLAQAGPLARLELLWVEPDLRGRGGGGMLLAHAWEHARRAGCLALTAWAQREGSLRYYLVRRGFAEAGWASHFLAEQPA